MPIGEAHNLFLQAVLSYKFVDEDTAMRLYCRACDDNKVSYSKTAQGLSAFITTINQNLKPLFISLAATYREDNGQRIYGIVNELADEHSKATVGVTVENLQFFQHIVEAIATSDEGLVSSIDALNMGLTLERKLGAKATAEALDILCKDGWLVMVEDAYTLGPKSSLELSSHIEKNYADSARKCPICQRLAVLGQVCPNCDEKMHVPCLQKYFAKGGEKCFKCKQPWEKDLFTVLPSKLNEHNIDDVEERDAPGPMRVPRRSHLVDAVPQREKRSRSTRSTRRS